MSWISGLDEVEEHLRQRSFLLRTLQTSTCAVIQTYMQQPSLPLTAASSAVNSLIDAYLAILNYQLLPSVAGVWVVLQKASIPSKLLHASNDALYAKRAIAFLLNTQVGDDRVFHSQGLRDFFASFSKAQWSQFYKKASIFTIQENVPFSPPLHSSATQSFTGQEQLLACVSELL